MRSQGELKASKRKRDAEEHSKRKRAKRDRLSAQHEIANGQPDSTNPSNAPPLQQEGIPETATPLKKKRQKQKSKGEKTAGPKDAVAKSTRAPRSQLPSWKVSQPMGGRMLDIDPILTADEKHIILPYNTSLQVYSCADSLLLRNIKLPISSGADYPEHIISISLSPSDPHLVWVASSSGRIWLIDWTTGDGSNSHLRVKCELLSGMTVESMVIGKESRDVPLVCIGKGQNWSIVACDVRNLDLKSTRTLLSQKTLIHNIQSAEKGNTLVASAERNVLLGSLRSRNVTSVDQIDYEFFSFDCSDEITCLDIRATERIHLNRASQRKEGDDAVIDVAVGCARGAVFSYNDLLSQLRVLQNAKSRHFSIQPRKYHWHRRAVHAVKWSRDGNYILSGGSESTLVLWQLDTGKLDFLPHLSASIENIVVSARGSSYALHLDDNSAMVLSTAEMKPTTYVAGVQTLISPQPFSKDELVRRVGQQYTSRLFKTPTAISPSDTSRISFCVGNGQQIGYSGSGPSTPLIQTLDLNTIQSISKQALTRTNPTDVNMTTKGHPITEPRITEMAYSRDGRWLATVDEWQPPLRDVDTLEGAASERREVYLKFWAVSQEDHSLELISRINAPHYSGQSEPVLDLAADPSAHRFATIGKDGVIRLWQTAVRKRDGIVVKSQAGLPLQSWVCSQAIHLREKEATDGPDMVAVRSPLHESGALSFSEDGSTLVCAFGDGQESMVHVIDAESGKVRASLNGLCQGDIQGVGLLSSSLIIVSDDLVVYDLVLDELRYGIQLRGGSGAGGSSDEQQQQQQRPTGPSILTHLALDHQTASFAVAIVRRKLESLSVRTELAVFRPDRSEPELVRAFADPITAVVPSVGSSGFLVLDAAAQLWSVAQGTETRSAFAQSLADLNLLGQEEQQSDREERVGAAAVAGHVVEDTSIALIEADGEEDDEAISDDDRMDVDVHTAAGGGDGDGDEDVYPAVVPPQKLAELFDAAPAFAMPPIEDMFYQVTKLFSAANPTPAMAAAAR
ncbi:NET1-associated nuclear protein 1 [Diatrype stigma]|uniref:NET1-associated nuclear protein 1 n=1 Tax=Diatrype stigma TaxID=117547 RepID=A0AAN9UNP0_9PEZI